MPIDHDSPSDALRAFLARWAPAQASERSNYQSFLKELCAVFGAPEPEPATGDPAADAYVFERPVTFQDGAKQSTGFIDLYRRGHFVLETKQGADAERLAGGTRRVGHGARESRTWDREMEAAARQAGRYARNLPASEPRPPLVIVCDVGYCVDFYADFSHPGLYVPYPDAPTFRLYLRQLGVEGRVGDEARDRVHRALHDAAELDPARRQARVTRKLAGTLAELASRLEAEGHAPGDVFGFLSRCLFTMFAEDAGLLPEHAFTRVLESYQTEVDLLPQGLAALWRAMDEGGFAPDARAQLRRFNGALFADHSALPVGPEGLRLLLEASRSDWKDVEPAIFGTLLERALDPEERHSLGAHFTPRAYVERLVVPTIVEPLREEWEAVQAAVAAQEASAEGTRGDGRNERADARLDARTRDRVIGDVEGFLRRLTSVRILDPACGTGNFLYVAFEHLKRLEGEVRRTLAQYGQSPLELEHSTVTPAQLLGIEINPRASAIAELVLWIGYLRWQLRTYGTADAIEDPVLRSYGNIENRDAVLAPDGTSAPWPAAEFIVGNPPFLGKGERMRAALGQHYLDALAAAYPEVPASADYVLYWWERAARAVRGGAIERFGLITTNSLSMAFNRRVVERHLVANDEALVLDYVVPDHPWVDGGADVRVAMTVGVRADGRPVGRHLRVVAERGRGEGGVAQVELAETHGRINADLSVGIDVTDAEPLESNERLSSFGVMLAGRGFLVSPEEAGALGLGRVPGLEAHLRPTLNGRDLAQPQRERFVIDFSRLSADEARERFPEAFDHVVRTVKPERDKNRDPAFRIKWWLHGRSRPALREALGGLPRYIATPETAKHRLFVFLDAAILPEHKLIAIALQDAYHLGVLSSSVHTTWALASGGRLGVGNDPVYNSTRCFAPFAFPASTPALQPVIGELGEAIDAHRKRRQAKRPGLTLTDLYNAVEALRAGRELTAKESAARDAGLADTLLELHRRLDRAVLEAYGWDDLDAESPAFRPAVLERLVALNRDRRAEEEGGLIRWLRPEFQAAGRAGAQSSLGVPAAAAPAAAPAPEPWPAGVSVRVRALRRALREVGGPVDAGALTGRFTGARRAEVAELLEVIVELGQARRTEAGAYAA